MSDVLPGAGRPRAKGFLDKASKWMGALHDMETCFHIGTKCK